MFICGMGLWCASTIKPGLSLVRPVSEDLKTTVVHSYKSPLNDVKPVHSHNLTYIDILEN